MIIEAKLWKYSAGAGAWYFLSSTKTQGVELRRERKGGKGFGSVRVNVRIGSTRFATSLFPTSDGPFLLPVKASVRRREGLEEGAFVRAECAFL